MSGWGRTLVAVVRARPVTGALLLMVLGVSVTALVVRVSHGSDAASSVIALVATGTSPVFELGRWWTVLTYPLATLGPRDLAISLVVVAVLCGFVEPRAGARRMVIAALGSTLAGAAVGLGLEHLSDALALGWFPPARAIHLVDPQAMAVGAALAGSALLDRVWRRRVRIFVLLGVVLGIVYLGQLDDIVRGGAAIGGLAIGLWFGRPPEGERWQRSSAHETRVLLASATAMLGLGPLIALLEPHRHSLAGPVVQLLLGSTERHPAENECRVWDVTTTCIQQESVSASLTLPEVLLSAVPWLLFLVIAWGIWRGRRLAIQIGVAVDVVLVVLFAWYWILAPDADGETVPDASRVESTQFVLQVVAILAIHVAAAVALWRWRDCCPLLPDRRRAVRASLLVAATAVALLVVYVVAVLAVPSAWSPVPTFGDIVADAPERLFPPALLVATTVQFAPVTVPAIILHSAMSPVFDLVLLAACWSALSAVSSRSDTVDRSTLTGLLRRGGGTSISFMATWPGMRAWIDDRTGACVTYRVEQRVAIALGTPFGAPDADPIDVLQRFATAADTNGLIPCVYSVPMELAPGFAAIGWGTLEVAEESVVRLGGWEMKGKKWQDVRSSINRADREGVEVRWCRFDELTRAEHDQVREISEAWSQDKSLPEMGFTLGGLPELDDVDVVLALAIDRAGVVQAVTSWLPVWRDGVLVGRTLDVMRRRHDSMNGVMEMLIARVAQRLQEQGAEFLSLSAAPLASSVARGSDGDATVLDQLLVVLGARLEPVYGFRSLLNFKRKFQPEMTPLGLVTVEPVHLPAIGLALTQAYLPGVSLGRLLEAFRPARDDST